MSKTDKFLLLLISFYVYGLGVETFKVKSSRPHVVSLDIKMVHRVSKTTLKRKTSVSVRLIFS